MTDGGEQADPEQADPEQGCRKRGCREATASKAALRARLLTARAARSDSGRTAAGLAIAGATRALDVRLRSATVVAAYLSIGSEPPTGPLLAMLADAGVTLIVPVLLDGGALDWAPYRPGDPVAAGLHGTIQPISPPLGVDAVSGADVVFVPALAADRRGGRLGRGGGSYDRALTRVRAGASVVAVVYDDEVLTEVPMQAHDRRVDATLTPSGLAIRPQYPPS